MFPLIMTAKLNDLNPQAWLADVFARMAEYPTSKTDELLAWNWKRRNASSRSGRLNLKPSLPPVAPARTPQSCAFVGCVQEHQAQQALLFGGIFAIV
jgi:IS66 C-terminal element